MVLCGSDIRFKIMCKISSISGLISHYFTHFLFSLKTPFQTLSAFPIFFGRCRRTPKTEQIPHKIRIFVEIRCENIPQIGNREKIGKNQEALKNQKCSQIFKFEVNPLGTRSILSLKLEEWKYTYNVELGCVHVFIPDRSTCILSPAEYYKIHLHR